MIENKFTPVHKLVLTALIVHSEKNQIQVTYNELSKITGLAKRTLIKAIDHLCLHDVLNKESVFSKDEYMNYGQQANLYTVKTTINELFNKGL